MELPDLSQKEIEHIVKTEIMPSIKKMDREQLNNLYYLALKKIEEITKDYNKLLDELNSIKNVNTNVSGSNDDDDDNTVFTPRKYTGKSNTTKGIIKRNTRNWTYKPMTPPITLFRYLGEPSYAEIERQNTPPRRKTGKTDKGGKRGKNIKTMRKYSKK
jgi:hypothetical protein